MQPFVIKRKNIRIVHNRVLGGWFVVRGKHDTPLSGRFDTKAEAEEWLNRDKAEQKIFNALQQAQRRRWK